MTEAQWRSAQERHAARIEAVTGPHLRRRSAGRKHPVVDFLFEYYRFRPATLAAWSPGVGVLLQGDVRPFADRKHFVSGPDGALVSVEGLRGGRVESTRWILALLEATQGRAPHYGCHGLHEWAMVHGAPSVRHGSTPLRLSRRRIAEVVEAAPITCTHFDAFRFFTETSRPLNRTPLTADRVHQNEQPGCLHANMDVYRWAMKRHPWVPSDLIADAFELALEIREVDMRASPYQLDDLGYEPIRIEEEAGKAAYRRCQEAFHGRAAALRAELIGAYRRTLEALDAPVSSATASF